METVKLKLVVTVSDGVRDVDGDADKLLDLELVSDGDCVTVVEPLIVSSTVGLCVQERESDKDTVRVPVRSLVGEKVTDSVSDRVPVRSCVAVCEALSDMVRLDVSVLLRVCEGVTVAVIV